MYQYFTTPRAMNFGHSHMDAWGDSFDELNAVYSSVGHSPPSTRHSAHHGHTPAPHSQYPAQRPLHTTVPLQTAAFQSSSQSQSWPSYEPSGVSQHYLSNTFAQSSPFAHNVPAYASQIAQSSYSSQPQCLSSRLLPLSTPVSNDTASQHRLTMAGSLDPSTGIFYRTPEHPRLRTAQACEKCRIRKAKCSGEHPSCKRCLTRGLVCEYAKEGRVRGPNKPKRTMPRASAVTEEVATSSAGRRPGSQQRASSGTASTPSPVPSPAQSAGVLAETTLAAQLTTETSLSQRYRSRRPSLTAHRPERSDRPRPPELSLDTVSPYIRLPSDGDLEYPASSGGYSRSANTQLSSSQMMYDYSLPADGERSVTSNHPYPDSSDGSLSNPHSAVSLTFCNRTPPRAFESTPPHSDLNYHYNPTPPVASHPHAYRPTSSDDYNQTVAEYSYNTCLRTPQSLVEGQDRA